METKEGGRALERQEGWTLAGLSAERRDWHGEPVRSDCSHDVEKLSSRRTMQHLDFIFVAQAAFTRGNSKFAEFLDGEQNTDPERLHDRRPGASLAEGSPVPACRCVCLEARANSSRCQCSKSARITGPPERRTQTVKKARPPYAKGASLESLFASILGESN